MKWLKMSDPQYLGVPQPPDKSSVKQPEQSGPQNILPQGHDLVAKGLWELSEP